MDPEEIKVGETYNVRMNFHRIDEDGDFCFRVFGGDDAVRYLKPTQVERAVYPLSDMANGIKNTEPAPKYDPCRKFRKGDKVRLVPFHGRCPIMYGGNVFGIEEILTVEENENKEYEVLVNGTSARQMFHSCFLELVTPVEELEPYSVNENTYSKSMEVRRGNPLRVCAAYYYGGECPSYTKDAAKKAAEAERDRLNAEHRKEQS